jgi:hypothetical protein
MVVTLFLFLNVFNVNRRRFDELRLGVELRITQNGVGGATRREGHERRLNF